MNQQIAKILEEKRHCKINENWLNSCLSFMQKHSYLNAEMMADKVFEQIANSDLKLSCKGSLLSSIKDSKKITGTHLFQVENSLNIGENYERREEDSRGRCMKVNLNDGMNDIWAFEYQRIPQFSVGIPPGTKIEITDAIVRRGMVLLTPLNTKVIGGVVKEMVDAWKQKKESALNKNNQTVDAIVNNNVIEKEKMDPISLVSDGEDNDLYYDASDFGIDDFDDYNYNDELNDESFVDMDDPQLAPYTYLSQVIRELEDKSKDSSYSKLYNPTNPSKFVKVKGAVTNLVKPFQFQKGKFSLDVEIDDGHSGKMLVTLSDPVIERILGMNCEEFKKNLGEPVTKTHNMNKLKDMEKELARMEGIFSMEFTLGSKPIVNDISDPKLEEILKFCNCLEAEESKKKREGDIKGERETKKKMKVEEDFEIT